MRHGPIEGAGSRLARHTVRMTAHMRMTAERCVQKVAGDLDNHPKGSQRPHRGTHLDGRGEDQRGRRDEDGSHHCRRLAASRNVSEDRKRGSQCAQGGSGSGARHDGSVSPAQGHPRSHA